MYLATDFKIQNGNYLEYILYITSICYDIWRLHFISHMKNLVRLIINFANQIHTHTHTYYKQSTY